MTGQNRNETEVVNEQRQTSQLSTADIAAASNKRSVDTTQEVARRDNRGSAAAARQ